MYTRCAHIYIVYIVRRWVTTKKEVLFLTTEVWTADTLFLGLFLCVSPKWVVELRMMAKICPYFLPILQLGLRIFAAFLFRTDWNEIWGRGEEMLTSAHNKIESWNYRKNLVVFKFTAMGNPASLLRTITQPLQHLHSTDSLVNCNLCHKWYPQLNVISKCNSYTPSQISSFIIICILKFLSTSNMWNVLQYHYLYLRRSDILYQMSVNFEKCYNHLKFLSDGKVHDDIVIGNFLKPNFRYSLSDRLTFTNFTSK